MAKQFPDNNWDLAETNGGIGTWQKVEIAVLMDIRRELRKLNTLLHCPNFVAIPRKLDAIHRKMPPRRRKKT